MRLTGFLAGALALGLATGAFADPANIQTSKLSEGHYRLVLKAADLPGPAEGQDRLEATARTLCGAEPVQFDRYQFDMLHNPDLAAPAGSKIGVLTQDIYCGQAQLQTVNSAVKADWKPSDNEVGHVRELTEAYLADRAAQKYDRAYALFSPKMTGTTSLQDWTAGVRAFEQMSGKVFEQQVRGIVWHNNTDVDPRGVFMVASTMSRYANGAACGYVVWERIDKSTYQLVREVSDFLPVTDLKALDTDTVTQLQKKYHCS